MAVSKSKGSVAKKTQPKKESKPAPKAALKEVQKFASLEEIARLEAKIASLEARIDRLVSRIPSAGIRRGGF